MITYSLLHSLGACYVGPRASPAQSALVARLPCSLADVVASEQVPIGDALWLVAQLDLDVVRRWALWCAGRALRYAGRWHDQVRDALRLVRLDPRAALTAAAEADAAAATWSATLVADAATLVADAAATPDPETERALQRAQLLRLVKKMEVRQ